MENDDRHRLQRLRDANDLMPEHYDRRIRAGI
jgi:hypothetical protein